MTSMRGDIVNRVRRLPKPTRTAEALQPVFEAISNSLHAIEDAFNSSFQSRGRVTVTLRDLSNPADTTIVVDDNGVGIDSVRFDAFRTTDTPFKLARGGKGIGRLLWLDAFENIRVVSIFQEHDKLFRRSFSFGLRCEDQIFDETLDELSYGSAATGTSITFNGLRGRHYQERFPRRRGNVVKHFGSHFFADFVLGRSPSIVVDVDGNIAEFPEAIENLRLEDRGEVEIVTKEFGLLNLASFVCHKSASASFDGYHQIHLVANGRTVTTRKIDGLLGLGRFGKDDNAVYHGCVTADFLDERVNQERTQFNFGEATIESIVRECAAHARENAIHTEVNKFDNLRLKTMQSFVEEYPSFGFEEAKKLLDRTPKNAVKAEQFAQALIPIRVRRDEERNNRIRNIVAKLDGSSEIHEEFGEVVRKAAAEVREEEQRQLTEYVLKRKTVLDVMEKLIRRLRTREGRTEDYHLESTLHQFICPMDVRGEDSAKVERSDHELWIIDERLTFTKYFASDTEFRDILADEASRQRPDLLIYDRLHGLGARGENPLKRVMLVEFKRPGRRDYEERYSPMSQISEYITRIQDGEIEDFEGGRVRVAKDCVFYCYVIADIVGKLETHTNGWRTTADGRGRMMELGGKFRGVVEIVEWVDLLADARMRNRAFLHAAGFRFDQEAESKAD